jgi:hypothetical protein
VSRGEQKKANNTDRRYTKFYYYIRNLWFEAKVGANQRIVHEHSSTVIAKRAKKEFDELIAGSTVRRWASMKDKDFSHRTWTQEWNRRIANGVVQAFRDGVPDNQAFPTLKALKNQDDTPKTPFQQLTDLKEQTIKMTGLSVTAIEGFLHSYLAQMEQDFEKSGYIWTDELEVKFHKVLPYLGSLKNTLLGELRDLSQTEKDIDPEVAYGRFVPLKDPQARERVRNAFKKFIEIAYKDQVKKKEEEGGNGDRKELEEKVETVSNRD